MQVDRDNLSTVLPLILKHIELADFVSFDCQFTGLVTKLDRIEGMFSNHIEFYERIKETAYNFRIIQLGLAAFVYDEGKYIPHVYNFYISPTTFAPGFNNVVVCEVESMEFLARNHLDFNRVFSSGIKSRRLYSEDKVQKHHYNQFPVASLDNMFLSPEEQGTVKEIELKIQPALTNPKLQRIVDFKNRTIFTYIRHKYLDLIFDKGKKNLNQFEYITRCRPHVEQFQEKYVAKDMKNLTALDSEQKIERQQEGKFQSLTEVSQGQEIKKPEINIVSKSMCLSQVFSALIAARKPIVGHFPNLDIGLIYQTFIADLPQTYNAFCQNLTQMFPWLLDTKVISRRIQSKIKGLKVDLPSLFKACSNPKLLKPYSNFEIKHLSDYVGKQHEAGYDAFITGCSFIGMANFVRGEAGKVNFNLLKAENMLLYSRFSGEVSLSGNGYCSNATDYDRLIIVMPSPKNPNWRELAEQLSKFGSLSVHEDREETYFVYEEPRDIGQIINMLPGWKVKKYDQRHIVQARNMYKEAPDNCMV